MIIIMIKGQKDYVTPKQGLILRYNGVFDLKKIYNSSKKWFNDNKYALTEKEYKEKPTSVGSEFNMVLESERDIDDYAKFFISLHIFIIDAKKADEKYNGKIKINISAYVLLDRANKWQTNSIKTFLFFVYNNFFIKDKIQNVYEDKIYSELMNIISNIKKYIKVN